MIQPSLKCISCRHRLFIDDENFTEPVFRHLCGVDDSVIDDFWWGQGECPSYLPPPSYN